MSFKSDNGLGKPMGGTSASYVDQMYSQWRADPNSVDPAWQKHFQTSGQGAPTPSSASSQSEVDAIVEALKASGFGSG